MESTGNFGRDSRGAHKQATGEPNNSPHPLTWTPDWLSVSGRLVVECPPGVGHLGGCPVGEP